MSATTAVCNSYKREVLEGVHLLADSYYIALIKNGAAGSFDKTTTNYSELGADEVPNGSGYLTGGMSLTGILSGLSGDTAYLEWDNAVWSNATISAIGAIIYNASRANKAVMVISFADTAAIPISSTNAAFTVIIPSSGVGQIRLT